MVKKINYNYDLIVIGAGHAGVEAASISDKLNKKVALITFNENDISSLPCNVSIGGSAKGIVVKELFALNGLMPQAADETQLQTKILNKSKGPAVWSLRAQIDKKKYPEWIKQNLKSRKNLDIVIGSVQNLIIENNICYGVVLEDGKKIYSRSTILCTGTFLRSKTMKGKIIKSEGPDGKKTTEEISNQLFGNEIELIRLKTGTPPRVFRDSIDFSKTKVEPGSSEPIYFTEDIEIKKPYENIPAWLVYTNVKTHEIIKKNFDKSYLFSTEINGAGPRYCPSIEDKVKRFYEKDQHQIFLELESKNDDSIYMSGISSSLPIEVQEEFLHTISGFENVKVKKYAYAIEYDAIEPTQLKQTLEFKKISNLYSAGQLNGTSGYEEAAAQGLYAAVNAINKIDKKPEFILNRNESYIGVMIDDITTRGIDDPYRLLTSRAEYRLLLRNDNAVRRLYKKAYENNLISIERYKYLDKKFNLFDSIIEKFKLTKLTLSNKKFNEFIINKKISLNVNSIPIIDLIKRPEISLFELIKFIEIDIPEIKELNNNDLNTMEVTIKFEGYIKRQEIEVKKYLKYQRILIPENFDYSLVKNLAIEAREKLTSFKPRTLNQAANIQGINPSDILIIGNYLNKKIQK